MQRKVARENAFLLIFEKVCKSDETSEEIFQKATEVRGLDYDEYVKKVFFGVCDNSDVIMQTAEQHFKGWKKERITAVSMALVELAIYEMMFMTDIPPRVSINEAIELSKKYDGEKSYTFVNGVLNSVLKSLQENE